MDHGFHRFWRPADVQIICSPGGVYIPARDSGLTAYGSGCAGIAWIVRVTPSSAWFCWVFPIKDSCRSTDRLNAN